VLVKCPAGIREVQTPGRASEQLYSEAIFEVRDPAADGRLGHTQAIGGGREAARLHDIDERLQIRESVHLLRFWQQTYL
jgi:hypothetical protein